MKTCCFVNTDDVPISITHVCYTSVIDDKDENVIISEVVREKYPHPDCPDIHVEVMTTRVVDKISKNSQRASAGHLMIHAQNNVENYLRTLSSEKR